VKCNPKAVGMDRGDWAGYYVRDGCFCGHNTDGH
jgi:hypothetical protein